MTKLTFIVNKKGFFGFDCQGHSNYSNSGSDIVCAAVSTAVQMTAAYLTKYYPELVSLVVDDEKAIISLRCADCFCEFDRQISVLVDFAADLHEQYSDYFTFDYLEV